MMKLLIIVYAVEYSVHVKPKICIGHPQKSADSEA